MTTSRHILFCVSLADISSGYALGQCELPPVNLAIALICVNCIAALSEKINISSPDSRIPQDV
jgi:hypothetical protein